jgi:hypothetical protein
MKDDSRYEKGDVRVAHFGKREDTPSQEAWWMDEDENYINGIDCEQDISEPCFFFPHQCDEWVIGGKDEAVQLIKDMLWALSNHWPSGVSTEAGRVLKIVENTDWED